MNKTRVAMAITAFAGVAMLAAAPANATPGQYTNGGDVTVTVAVEYGGCATVYYPRGNTDAFCGQQTFKQYNLTPGFKFGANVTSHTGSSVFCKVIDDSTGDVIKADFGYKGGAAICMSNSIN